MESTPATSAGPLRRAGGPALVRLIGLMLVLLGVAQGSVLFVLGRLNEVQGELAEAIETQREVEALNNALLRATRLFAETMAAEHGLQPETQNAAWRAVQRGIETLRARLAGEPQQNARLDDLDRRIGEQRRRWAEALGASGAERAQRLAEIQQQRLAIVDQFDAMRAEEGRQRERYAAALTRAVQRHRVGLGLLALLSVAMVLGLGALVRREARRRDAAESALAATLAGLERTVDERTRALRRAGARDHLHAECAAWLLASLADEDDLRVLEGCHRQLLASGLVAAAEFEFTGLPRVGTVEAAGAPDGAAPGERLQTIDLPHGLGRMRFLRGRGVEQAAEEATGVAAEQRFFELLAGWMQLRRERAAGRLAERQRAESAAQLGTLFESVPVGIALFDSRARLLRVNAPLARLAGREVGQMEGRTAVEAALPLLDEPVRAVLAGAGARAPERHVFGPRLLVVSVVPLHAGWPGSARAAAVVSDATALDRANDRLAQLARRLLEVEEAERRSLALELHDDLGQRLAAVKMNLGMMALVGSREERDALRADSMQIVEGCIAQVRERAMRLRPMQLDELGLEAALRAHVLAQQRRSGVPVALVVDPALARRRDDWALHVFRIVQEALRNALEHAAPTRIEIELACADGHVTLGVRDDGRGLPADAGARGTGLSGMRERVELLGGRFEAQALAPRGTEVRCRWRQAALGLPVAALTA